MKATSIELLVKLRNAPREALEKMVITASGYMYEADSLAAAVEAFLSKPRGVGDDRELKRALFAYERMKK